MNITGFGDYLIHFSPLSNDRFMQAEIMKISYTGAEANVCAALSLWGMNVSFVTRLPEHSLSKKGVMFLRSFGIDTESIVYGGKRMGLYFLENGASLRPSQVIYDRADSAFTEATVSDFDKDKILSHTDLLYVTGITPSLSNNLFECTLDFLKEAKKRGIKVVFDINYRSALSSVDQAGNVLRSLAPYITCLIGNEEHLKMLLSIVSRYGEDEKEARLREITEKTRNILGVSKIAVTVRRTLSASDAVTYASFFNGDEFAVSREYHIHVVDRVGSGDAFSAGIVYALQNGFSTERAVEFAEASCALKHTVLNDVNFVSKEEIFKLLENDTTDVKR